MVKNYISNKDETPRLFENNFLETLSKIHWTIPIFVFSPIIIYFFYKSFVLFNFELWKIVPQILFGLFTWTFIEYFLHRFVFHYNPSSKFGKRLHFLFHGVHHDYPNDSKRLVMPPSISLPLATLFFYFFQLSLGPITVFPFFTGFIGGYLIYDISHYAIHHFNMKSRFWLFIKNHHMKHHYQFDDKGFGVSQPFWDYVFGTTFPVKKDKN